MIYGNGINFDAETEKVYDEMVEKHPAQIFLKEKWNVLENIRKRIERNSWFNKQKRLWMV